MAAPLLYVTISVAAALFALLYRDALSLAVLILAVSMPIVQWIMLQCMKRGLRFRLEQPVPAQAKHLNFPVVVQIKSHSRLPISGAELTLTFRNILDDQLQTCTVRVPIQPDNTESISLQYSSEYCGIFRIELETVCLYDYFRLFHVRLHPRCAAEILILPELSEGKLSLTLPSRECSEGFAFSKSRPGDDCSEIFDLRDYRSGDRPNRIHWKLSTKQEQLIVREYSLPVSHTVLLLADPVQKSLPSLDALLEAYCSVASFLTDQEAVFQLGWQEQGALELFTIASPEDLAIGMGRLFRMPIPKQAQAEALLASITFPCPRILLVTNQLDDETVQALLSFRTAQNDADLRISVLYVVEEDVPLPQLPQPLELIPICGTLAEAGPIII